MLNDKKGIRNTKGYSRIDENGIVHANYIEGIEIDLADAKAEIERARKLGNGKKVLEIVYLDNVKDVSLRAKQFYASEEGAKVWIAVALLAKSPLSRTMGNVYLKINKPVFPVKMFSDKEKAIEWLKSFL